jgi:hypothetical protein
VTPHEFATKWMGNVRAERAAAQEHFIDLCRMLGEQTPNEADPDGEWYAFEKGAARLEGGDGYADVWKRGHFRLAVQGQEEGPRRRLPPAPRLLGRAREEVIGGR